MSQLDEVLALGANNTAGEFSLSGDSLAVLFYALDFVQNLNNWRDYSDEVLDDTTVDDIRALVDNATDSLMRPIMLVPPGATMLWHTNAPPTRWLLCTGGAVLKAEYPELYAVLGDKYGSTTDQFGLPDLTDVSPMGVGGLVSLDGNAGSPTHTLTTGEMPAHTHGPGSPHTNFFGFRSGGTNTAPVGTALGVMGATASAGGGGAHNNLSPVFGVYFIIYGGKE
jgi:microcystin-dependent protein